MAARHGRRVRRIATPYIHASAPDTFLFLIFGLSFLWPFRLVTQISLRAELLRVLIFGAAFTLTAAPIIVYFSLNPEHLFLRSSALWLFDPNRGLESPLLVFLRNVWGYLMLFGFSGDPDWRHNYAGRPMLNLWEAAFFWFGVVVAFRHWKLLPIGSCSSGLA